jgi:hypothetical protein
MGGFPGLFNWLLHRIIQEENSGRRGPFPLAGFISRLFQKRFDLFHRAAFFLFVPFGIQVNAFSIAGVNMPCRFFQNIFFLCSTG